MSIRPPIICMIYVDNKLYGMRRYWQVPNQGDYIWLTGPLDGKHSVKCREFVDNDRSDPVDSQRVHIFVRREVV